MNSILFQLGLSLASLGLHTSLVAQDMYYLLNLLKASKKGRSKQATE